MNKTNTMTGKKGMKHRGPERVRIQVYLEVHTLDKLMRIKVVEGKVGSFSKYAGCILCKYASENDAILMGHEVNNNDFD